MVNREGEPLTLRDFIGRKRTIISLQIREKFTWKIYEQHMSKPVYDKINIRENRITGHLFLSVHKEFCPCCYGFTCCVVFKLDWNLSNFDKKEYNSFHSLDAI